MRFAVALLLVLLAAPANARAEQVSAERLREFMTLAPPAPPGWARSEKPYVSSNPRESIFAVTYSAMDGREFRFGIVFSKERADSQRLLVRNFAQHKAAGIEIVKIKGRDAMAATPDATLKGAVPVYSVVVSPTRIVAITDRSASIDREMLRAMLESVDFDAVARK